MTLCECGCGEVVKRRFVSGHNGRVRPKPTSPLALRILARCIRDGDCLIWQGSTIRGGYGMCTDNRRRHYVHRVVFEHFNGPIPQGMEVDHVRAKGCLSTACCEIGHLEVVTPQINTHRSDNPAGLNARKTHCIRGHELSGDNLIAVDLARGQRQCRKCARIRDERRRSDKRMASERRGGR